MPKERVQTVVERLGSPLAAELGYELVEVEYHKEGPDWILRCTIDQEQGISTDDCQRFSVALEQVLDQADPIPGSYLLEVSSPGLERPLKTDRDFIRFSGSQVEIKLDKPLNNQKSYRGELLGMRETETEKLIQLKINDKQVLEIPRNDIAKAKLNTEVFGKEGGRKQK